MTLSIRDAVRDLNDELVETRRDLHRHPELGFAEKRTAGIVADRLRSLGLEVQEGIAGTGVVGLLKGGPGPTILVRADMDGLPIVEENQVEYRSDNRAMHACGHDGHVSIALAAARVLAKQRQTLPGSVKFCFQPAEEGPGGALPMIEQGVLQGVDACVGLHIWNELPCGRIGLQPGPIMACADRFTVDIEGTGGHGAAPHRTVDPIVVSAHVITALQTIVSRNSDPLKSVVVTIGSIAGGTAHNVIPPRVHLEGTFRVLDPALRDRVIERIRDVTHGVCQALGAKAMVTPDFGYPVTVNEPRMTELVSQVIREAAGPDAITGAQTLGGEDMSYFLQRVPGAFFFLGGNNPDQGLDSPHHSPTFNFDERCLPLGVELMVRSVERYLERGISPS
ncbi:MAG: M20 metallopeptidase family protein [Candidatus Xenobia bacterium]